MRVVERECRGCSPGGEGNQVVGTVKEAASEAAALPCRVVPCALRALGVLQAARALFAAGSAPWRLVIRGPWLGRRWVRDGDQVWVAPGTAGLAEDGELAAVVSADGRRYAVGVLDRSAGRPVLWSDWNVPDGEEQRELGCGPDPVLIGPAIPLREKRARADGAVRASEAQVRAAWGLPTDERPDRRARREVPVPFLRAMRATA